MASRNTSAAASNESAIAPRRPPLPSSGRPCRTWWSGRRPECGDPDRGTTARGVLGAMGDRQIAKKTRKQPRAHLILRSSDQLRCRLLLRKRADTVGEIAGLAESSTYAGKSARIVASIRTETGSLSFLAQP